jgi:hypothetical protein
VASVTIKLQLAGEPHEIAVRPVDRIKLERILGQGIMKVFSEDKISEENTMRLAWVACQRLKISPADQTFDQFIELLDDIEEEVQASAPLDGTAEGTSNP